MIAAKCDRCGKLFENKDLFDLSGAKRFYSVLMHTIPDAYSRMLDLCPECGKALQKWIEQKLPLPGEEPRAAEEYGREGRQ